MVLLVDNFDSFTWNIVHAATRCVPGVHVNVVRTDQLTVERAEGMKPRAIIVSPGPCGPADAPVSIEIIRRFAGRVPILGICLGHQCLAAAFGMAVVRAPTPVHGKPSPIHHDGMGIFEGLPSPLAGMRYHSLMVDAASVNRNEWAVSAWCSGLQPASEAADTPIVMGLRRRWNRAALEGVQFHPESFATPLGERLLGRFLESGAISDRAAQVEG